MSDTSANPPTDTGTSGLGGPKLDPSSATAQPAGKSRIRAVAVWFALTLLAAVIGWYVRDRLTDIKDGDVTTKYIAVVMSGTDRTFTIPTEFKQGFGDQPSFTTSKGQMILIEKKEDLYSKEQAKIVAEALIKDPRCVLIIGNSNSELTEVTLDTILAAKDRPAFLLPIATADNIISKAMSEKFFSILRMVPDNQNQGAVIKRLIFGKISRDPKVAILVDEENQTYSINLSKNVAAEVITEGGTIVLNRSYGNSNRLLDQLLVLRANRILPDVIVYVGVTSNGMLLIQELMALRLAIPVVFTDGCTVKELMSKARQLPGPAYFLSAVSMSEVGFEPTYKPIGQDAFSLAKMILNSIEGPITRESVREFVAENKVKISLDAGFAGAYAFNPEGNNKKMEFKTYTYIDGMLSEVIGIR